MLLRHHERTQAGSAPAALVAPHSPQRILPYTPPTYFAVDQGEEEEKGESNSLSSLIDINELTPHYPYGASEHQDELGGQSSSSSQPSTAINKKNRLKEMPSHTLMKLHNSSYTYIPLNLVQQANTQLAPAAGPTLHPRSAATKAHKQMTTLSRPLPGSPSYSLPTTVVQCMLYTVPSGKFKSLNLSHLTTLIFQLTDNTITNYLQIKREKLLVQRKKALSMVHSTLNKPLQVAFKEISDPHNLIKYILMKHHTNSSSHLSLITTSLHALHQGTKETVEQYLLHAKKLRDELKPHPEWRVATSQLKSHIFTGL